MPSLLVAVLAIAVLALLLRWTYGVSRRRQPPPRAGGDDFGLLVEVARAPGPVQARQLRDRLNEAGIRSTTASVGRGSADGVRILAFGDDAERARETLGTTPR